MSSLVARDLRVRRGGHEVLAGVDLELRAGRLTVLLGPNGAGKSTTLAALAGHLRPDAGTLQFQGRPLSAWAPRQLARHLALIGQEARGPLPLRVRQVVELGRLPHRGSGPLGPVDHRLVEEALSKVGCLHLAERAFGTLSAGESQKVHWARALCQQPHVLLMDEATAHLDVAAREAQLMRASAFCAAGGAVLAVVHDLDVALRHAHWLVVLDRGRSIAAGPAELVLTPRLLRDVFAIRARIQTSAEGRWLQILGAHVAPDLARTSSGPPARDLEVQP